MFLIKAGTALLFCLWNVRCVYVFRLASLGNIDEHQVFMENREWETKVLQTRRLVEVGKDLWRSSGPTPLLEQGHLELVAQDHIQMAFEYLQGGRLPTTSLGRL